MEATWTWALSKSRVRFGGAMWVRGSCAVRQTWAVEAEDAKHRDNMSISRASHVNWTGKCHCAFGLIFFDFILFHHYPEAVHGIFSASSILVVADVYASPL